MTGRLRLVDRLVVLLVGLALLAVGLLGLDWRYDGLSDVTDLPERLDTSPTADVVTTTWWPWAAAAGGIVLGLVGLWWLLAHLRRPGPASRRLAGSGPTGVLDVDLRSVASACAERFATQAPVLAVRGTTRTIGSRTVVLLTGQVDPYADPASLADAATRCAADLAAAFPDEGLTCRVVLDAPRRPGRRVRVR